MVNKLLTRKADKSVAKALREALKVPGGITFESASKIVQAAHDGDKLDDVEFRDLKRILRTQPLSLPARTLLEVYIELYYPLVGPYVFADAAKLDGTKARGNGACAQLVQYTLPPVGLAATWREGIRVRGNGHLIAQGTAVATFEDGLYANRDHGNHVAYYISQDATAIYVIDQWTGKKPSERPMSFQGQTADGLFLDPSNNGDALSVIMKKKD